ncbi:haloacid dehalogenase-like hydrolase, partial [Pantoea allii]|uniref:haloacid dehalogenase-like hydrolase n=1 Tax=Pantoea allii TaxID=574096 RepID=UPI003D31139C
LTPGGRTLVATMRRHGAHTCMVSGGFTLFTDRVAAMIGFDANRANSLTVLDGHKLAGTVAEPIFGRDGKRAALIELRDQFALAPIET